MNWLSTLLWIVAFSALTSAASAHKLAPSLFELTEKSPRVYEVLLKTPGTLPTPEPIAAFLPDHCTELSQRQPGLDSLGVTFTWLAECSGNGLPGSTIRFSGLEVNQSAAVVRIDLLDGRSYRHLLNGGRAEFLVPERQQRGAVVRDYTWLGIEHILGGIDHLFFVWALVLMLPTKKLLIALTAFTLGHSLTLSLAALSFIRVPQELTEFAIALSIFFLAAELARSRLMSGIETSAHGLVARHAFWVCLAFGLLHGLGFAGALRDIGFPQEELIAALVMFNIGVEIGQILFTGSALLIGAAMTQVSKVHLPVLAPARWVWLPIYLIGSGSTFWCIDRSIGLIG